MNLDAQILAKLNKGGVSVPVAGVSFAGMPLHGDVSGGKSSNGMYGYAISFKYGSTLVHSFGSTIFTGSITLANNNGSYLYVSGNNAWHTLLNTSGTSGKLFNVISPSLAAGATFEIRITKDGGKPHIYSGTVALANNMIVLGALIQMSAAPTTTTAALGYNTLGPVLQSYPDVGFAPLSASNHYLLSPRRALVEGHPFIGWDDSILVEVRATGVSALYSSYYAAGVYSYD